MYQAPKCISKTTHSKIHHISLHFLCLYMFYKHDFTFHIGREIEKDHFLEQLTPFAYLREDGGTDT